MVHKHIFRLLLLLNFMSGVALYWLELTGMGVLSVIPPQSLGFSDDVVYWAMLASGFLLILLYGLMIALWPPARYVFFLLAVWWVVDPFLGFALTTVPEGGLLSNRPVMPPLEFAVANLHALVLGVIVTLSFTSDVFKRAGR